MGYRSEVGLVITKEGYERLQAEMAKDASLKTRIENVLDDANKIIQDNKTKDRLYLWEWYKWYDLALDIILNGKIGEDNYLFIRIGEDLGDIQIYGAYFNNSFEFEMKRHLAYTDSGDITTIQAFG